MKNDLNNNFNMTNRRLSVISDPGINFASLTRKNTEPYGPQQKDHDASLREKYVLVLVTGGTLCMKKNPKGMLKSG